MLAVPTLQVGCDEASRVGCEGGDVSDAGPPSDAGDGRQTREVASASWSACSAFGEHRAVMSPRRFGGFDREQDAALGIDLEVRLRRRGKLAGLARRASSRASFRRTSANAASAEAAAASTANPASVARRLRARRRAAASAAARASVEEVALAGGQREVGRARPGFELGEPALARQVLRIAPGVVPLLRPPRRDAGGGGGPRGAPRSSSRAGPTG